MKFIKFVDLKMYHAQVVFLVGITAYDFEMLYYDNNRKITDDERKEFIGEITDEHGCNGLTCLLDSGDVLVYIRHAEYEGDVSHEIYHAANKVLVQRGFEAVDEEAWAYLIGYLTDEYYDALRDEMEKMERKDKKDD